MSTGLNVSSALILAIALTRILGLVGLKIQEFSLNLS
jgi:hypothetical protein